MHTLSVISRVTLLMLFTCSTLTLSGCTGVKRPAPAAKPIAVDDSDKRQAEKEAGRLAQCQKELDALKGINPEQHKSYRQEFDHLMRGAAQYAGVRTQVNSTTQDTVDALYRYKVSRLCANIEQATLSGLAERGERLE
ncbi:Uncharacterised protein [Serratia proteamaculans]|uniref:hypothetical protein n=1 Tax=Serratia proteamaculans TaxID=28151 RepID=UPI00217ACA46|nr:hypothetical protein [Serratia proteamaculans]CAI2021229.1 Uncharacterised protein [Serratia proteamaculans]